MDKFITKEKDKKINKIEEYVILNCELTIDIKN